MIPYNPLDKSNLAESLAWALLRKEAKPIADTPSDGAGVYTIYYRGGHPLYERLVQGNAVRKCEIPIYVGKAVTPGSRRGTAVRGGLSRALAGRIAQHTGSISACSNLSADDFWCRVLVVDDLWISLTEAALLSLFKPVWNSVLDGFGNHDPGSGRLRGKRPQWDTVHPGRAWAARLPASSSGIRRLEEAVRRHLEMTRVPDFAAPSCETLDELVT